MILVDRKKKNKKNIVFYFIISLFIFMGISNVKAIYNGVGGTVIKGSGNCNNLPNYCTYYNGDFAAVQLTLKYYDGNTWTDIGHSYYIINENNANMVSTLQKDVGGAQYVEVNNKISTCGAKSGPGRTGCYYNYKWLAERYSDNSSNKNQAKKNVENLFAKMGVNADDLTKPNDDGIGYYKKGYRIFIEPLWNFIAPNNGPSRLYTIKEVYALGGTSNPNQWADHSVLLTTEKDDVGIRAHGMNKTNNIQLIAAANEGYGYNIINPAMKRCFKLVLTSENPKCVNTNKQNTGWYKETFQTTDCEEDKKNVVENATEYGRLVKTINNDCKIYCKEEVEVAYPGNVLPALPVGGNFIWPTFNKTGAYNKNNVHNLNITGKRVCTVVGNSCGTSKVTTKDLYNDFKSSITLKYNQENYKENIKLDKAENTSICDGCENLTDQKKISVVHNVSLKLPDKTYRYVNKQTKIASHTMSLDSTKYTDIGYGNLPIASTAKTDRNYNLEFTNISLGANGVFSKLASESTYKCTYRAKNTQNSCICPSGTTSAGKDLWCKIAKGEDINCPTAQMQYCNTNFGADDDTCPSKYCTNNPEISLETCVTAGNSYEACEAKLCSGGKKYECPKNTPNEFMDISWCVENGIAKGQSEEEAIKICQDVVCPANGIPIIYRTIDLRNPFPSKKLNGGIKGFNTDDISGRYPGANWNSKKLVEVEIRNNRGVEDEEVYKKEPLYKFVLDAKTIRTVRKYNKNQKRGAGYSDFTLSCEGTTKNEKGDIIKDGSKCFSYTFLRGTVKSALTGGTCASANANTFDSCAS